MGDGFHPAKETDMQTQTTGEIRPNSIDFSHRLYDCNGKTNIAGFVGGAA